MRMKLYDFFVNKHIGISKRYHDLHDGANVFIRLVSYFYLLWLNVRYYLLFDKNLDESIISDDGKKNLLDLSESEKNKLVNCDVDNLFLEKDRFEIFSFDIFDTLIFRPLGNPTEAFFLIGEKLKIADFKNIRINAEMKARTQCFAEKGHSEVSLRDIWNEIGRETGADVEKGMQTEMNVERSLCYANPFMLKVWEELKRKNKRIVVTSDMYLPKKFLEELLVSNGYSSYEKLYVSCEYGKNKASGSLYEVVREDLGKDICICHIGDNENSDMKMAKKVGLFAVHYPNVNRNIMLYRPFDMEAVIGAGYRGVVNNRIYNGLNSYSMEYEYGFIYGGLFVAGYCNYIHEFVKNHGVDKALFLSRDGDILKQAYDYMFPGEKTEYVYWSRKPATILMARYDKHDYFRRFIYHKVNSGVTVEEALVSMGLDSFFGRIGSESGFELKERLTEKNSEKVRDFVERQWDDVLKLYSEEQKAAGKYYSDILNGCKKAVAVDIGWAGSGAIALQTLAEKEWKIPCEIIGLLAGTNTCSNAEPDATETFLLTGKLCAYLYSQSHNRDLLKKHDPNKDYNVFWELLLSSPTPKFQGFVLKEDGSVGFDFGKYDENLEGIRDIQSGIMDFVKDYTERFKDFPYMLNISGRDAYAPMLVAASHDEKYLKAIEKKFSLEIQVN